METKKIISIIAEQLSITPAELTLDTTFEDLGADSLDLFQIINALEEEFEMEFDPDDEEKIRTVGDAVEYIKKLTAE